MEIDGKVIGVALLMAFLAIQIFTFLMVIILRYHFRAFSLPGDRRAGLLAKAVAFGSVAFLIASAFSVYRFLP
ncbi:MAG TPA: hypothetical protein VJB92_03920 [Candidatus Paceibacterota bacterium]